MFKFDTNEQNAKATTGSRYIVPGVHDNIQMVDINVGTSRNNNPVVNVKLESMDDNSFLEEGLPASETVSGSGKSPRMFTMWKLQDIALAVCTAEEFESIQGNTLEEFIDKYRSLVLGKPFRMKFSAEEIFSNGKHWDKARIPLPNKRGTVAESMDIPKEETKLKYDVNNPYDYKKAVQTVNILPLGETRAPII